MLLQLLQGYNYVNTCEPVLPMIIYSALPGLLYACVCPMALGYGLPPKCAIGLQTDCMVLCRPVVRLPDFHVYALWPTQPLRDDLQMSMNLAIAR